MPAGSSRPLPRRAAVVVVLVAATLGACAGTSGNQVELVEPPTADTEPATTSTVPPPDCAEQLPPAAQAGQMIMVMVTTPQLAAEWLASGRVGGFGLKGRQSADVGDQVAATVADAPIPPFVASDEEGGTVQRLEAALGALSGAGTLAEGDPGDAGRIVGDYASAMAELGFNMNFGPVADVGGGSDLGSRTFGDDPAVVADFVEQIAAAQEDAGITTVLKHWPGIGRGGSDPHLALEPLPALDDLRSSDLTVFDRAIATGVPGIMVAHATAEGLTGPDEPLSLSRTAITDELRGRQGFDGLIITDSLGMGAVVNVAPQDEATERTIAAGADVALLSGPEVAEAAHARLTEAITSGRIPAEQVTASVRRILALKGVEGQCLELAASLSGVEAAGASQGVGPGGSGTGSGSGSGAGNGPGGSGTGNGSGSGVGNGLGTGSGSGTGFGSDDEPDES